MLQFYSRREGLRPAHRMKTVYCIEAFLEPADAHALASQQKAMRNGHTDLRMVAHALFEGPTVSTH